MMILEIKNCNVILIEKHQKYQHYHLEQLINMNILQVKKYCLLIKEEEQNKLGLLILLQENRQKNKQNSADHRKQLFGSNELIKQILLLTEIVHHMKNKKQYLMNFCRQLLGINPNNLICSYKNEGRSPKDFCVYQNLIDLLKKVRDSNINPK